MIRPLNRTLGIGAALACLGSACGNEPTQSIVPSTLVVSPQTLTFSDTVTTQTLYLSTEPSNGRLEWNLVSKPAWLTVEPTSGVVSGIVSITVRAPGLATSEPGPYGGTLELISTGGAVQVQVAATVSANPVATVSANLAVAGSADTASFSITNTGRGPLFWNFQNTPAWMVLNPDQGFLPTGQQVRVRISVDKTTLPVGSVSTSLTLNTNTNAGTLSLPLSVTVSPTPKLALSSSRLAFPQGVTTRTFTLGNSGKGLLVWNVGAKAAWVTVSPTAGTVAPGETATLTATVDRVAVPGGAAVGSISFTSNAVNPSVPIAVEVTGTVPLPLGLRMLDHRVVDAEWSAASGLLVTVSAAPHRLNIVDVETGATAIVPLPQTPTSVSIRTDGAFAAVGHDGFVSYVNLASKTLVQTYAVSADALDVVLATNGFAYVFPRRDQWTTIFAIELATGAQSNNGNPTIYAGTVGRLHPSGEYIYGANNGLSPSDFEKYDIRGGAPRMLYDSPYHGDYDFAGDVWISEDGARLFARSGNVFRSSPVRSEDMTYAGNFEGILAVRWAADSRIRQRIYVLGGVGYPWDDYRTPSLTVYESGFLALRGSVALPTMPSGTGSVAVDGRFVFPSADGTRLNVLVQAVPSSGLLLDWGIVALNANSLP
jgi:hypothetical protein